MAADVQALAQLHRQTMELRALRDEYAELSRMDPCWTPGEPRPPSPPAPGPLPTSPDAVAAELAATRAAIDDWNARRAVCAEVAKAATALVEAQAANEVATAVDLTTLPALGPTPRTTKLEVHAADVDLDTLLMALDGGSIMRVADDAKVTGVLRAATAHDAALTLAGRSPTKAITSFRGGGRALRLAFADAPAADLWRLVAMVERLNVFLVADAPATTVVADGVGAEAFASGLVALHGHTLDKARRDVWVVRAADGPALDPALMKLGDAAVSIDSEGATLGELLAALRALAVARPLGAPCTAAPIAHLAWPGRRRSGRRWRPWRCAPRQTTADDRGVRAAGAGHADPGQSAAGARAGRRPPGRDRRGLGRARAASRRAELGRAGSSPKPACCDRRSARRLRDAWPHCAALPAPCSADEAWRAGRPRAPVRDRPPGRDHRASQARARGLPAARRQVAGGPGPERSADPTGRRRSRPAG
jgi:hypothetical protein